MHKLESIPDSSIDFINSGQSIEHIYEDQADEMLEHIIRILKPGGQFCLDTPNGRATRLQQKEFIDPDHKIEYTHTQLSRKLQKFGFNVLEAKGLNYLPNSFKNNYFNPSEAASNCGIYDDLENCYLLAYRCQKPFADQN